MTFACVKLKCKFDSPQWTKKHAAKQQATPRAPLAACDTVSIQGKGGGVSCVSQVLLVVGRTFFETQVFLTPNEEERSTWVTTPAPRELPQLAEGMWAVQPESLLLRKDKDATFRNEPLTQNLANLRHHLNQNAPAATRLPRMYKPRLQITLINQPPKVHTITRRQQFRVPGAAVAAATIAFHG